MGLGIGDGRSRQNLISQQHDSALQVAGAAQATTMEKDQQLANTPMREETKQAVRAGSANLAVTAATIRRAGADNIFVCFSKGYQGQRVDPGKVAEKANVEQYSPAKHGVIQHAVREDGSVIMTLPKELEKKFKGLYVVDDVLGNMPLKPIERLESGAIVFEGKTPVAQGSRLVLDLQKGGK